MILNLQFNMNYKMARQTIILKGDLALNQNRIKVLNIQAIFPSSLAFIKYAEQVVRGFKLTMRVLAGFFTFFES